jgi:hypothetical protein
VEEILRALEVEMPIDDDHKSDANPCAAGIEEFSNWAHNMEINICGLQASLPDRETRHYALALED